MRYYHATDEINLSGIRRLGLLARLASGKRPAVWFVSKANIDAAIRHCCIRRDVPASRVVVLEIEVQRKRVRRFGRRGYLYTTDDVTPDRIRVYGRLCLSVEV